MREHPRQSPAEIFQSANLSLYPTPLQRCPDLAVESDEAFDAPDLREPVPPKHDPEWLGFFIGKTLAGYDVPDPSPEEFVGWFKPDHTPTAQEGSIINSVLGELHRHGGMPWLWKLERTLGVSIRDIARTMREANVRASYPCIWINRYPWSRELARSGTERQQGLVRQSVDGLG